MIEEGIRGGICHSMHRYVKANNRYMKKYNKNKESSYIQYLDANNIYGWAMSQKLHVNDFKFECMTDSIKLSIRENPGHFILHVGTNNLNSTTDSAKCIAESIVEKTMESDTHDVIANCIKK